MNSCTKYLSITLLSAFLLAAAVPVPCSAEPPKGAAKKKGAEAKSSPSDPVAKVGSKTITRGELDRAVASLNAQKRLPKEGGAFELRKRTERLVLDQLVAAELLYQEGMKNPPKNLDNKVKARIAENKKKFAATIKESKLTEKELYEVTRKNIVIDDYVEKKLADKTKVTEEEIKKFFDANKEKLSKVVHVRASHILCGVDAKASAEERRKAKEKAAGLLQKVKGGADFAKLAKENSSCPSKSQGGDLGYFGKGDMTPPFERAAYALKPGEVSSVVESEYGFHIIKLTDRKEAKSVKLDDVKERIRDLLKAQKKQEALTTLLSSFKAHGKAEILLK